MLGRDYPGKEAESGRASQILGSRYIGCDASGWLHMGSEHFLLSHSGVAVSLRLCSSRFLKEVKDLYRSSLRK